MLPIKKLLGISDDSASKNLEKTKQLLENALVENDKSYGPDHFNVANTLGNLGDAYGALGDQNKQTTRRRCRSFSTKNDWIKTIYGQNERDGN